VERVGHPVIAICLILALGAVAWHMQLGMKVIIEDYVHGDALKPIALIANAFFAVVIAVAGAVAVLIISFGA
jgi:succinate dehydrogenase / fumarate reductase membrane anchor subunit